MAGNRKGIVVAVIIILIIIVIVALVCGLVFSSRKSYESPSVWNNLRLPTSLKPLKYDVHIRADIENFTFNGSVQILFKCDEKTNIVLLHSIALDINVNDILLKEDGSPDTTLSFRKTPWFHEENQYLVIELKEALKPGKVYTLYAEFSAPLGLEVAGFYRTSYETETGTRWIGSTMFAVAAARQVFPCFDEPAFKANFTITLDHAPEYQAISNMALNMSSSLADGWARSKFKESVPMSTYLVAWAVTDFAKKEKTTKNGVLFRVWARPDAIDTVDYALAKGGDIIDYYGEYYDTAFPLEKMDFIAVPGFTFIAMENWGMNVFEPAKFLYEEGVSSAMDKQLACVWIGHELAHQWFGNLVTLEWWSDVWLNEGFASYVEYLGMNITEPDWNMPDMFLYRDLHPVLVTDSLTTSRPISIPVSTLDEIYAQFDIISYNKGASLLRMLSHFLGEDTFRKGLKNYLLEFAYQNANKDDLWAELSAAAEEDDKGHINVKTIMDTWTLQMGYPVVTLTREYGRGDGNLHFKTEQQRFLLNPLSDTSSVYGDVGYVWYIPLTYTTGNTLEFLSPQQEWMKPGEALTISANSVDDSVWLLANVEGRGYYRVNYDIDNWQLLAQQLIDNHEVIKTSSRTSLLGDSFNIARAGLLSHGIALNLTKYMVAERDYVPWATFKEVTGYVGNMLSRTAAYGDFQKYMLQLVNPTYNFVGWDDPGTHLKRQLQSVVISLACSHGNEDCVSEATRQYTEWMNNPGSNSIKPDLKLSVYCTAIAEGGSEEWSFAFDQYKMTNSDTEKVALITGMACSKNTSIINTYLSYILDPTIIQVADGEKVIAGISRNDIGSEILWDFFWANWGYFHKTYNEAVFDFPKIVTSLTSGLNTPDELDQFQSLLEANPDQGIAERPFQLAVEATRSNIQWMQNNYDDIAMWLKNQL
ncbi:aminopeptidase N-like isoform X1 [Amphiura filiformis]|uniref:aminopeptidase N-like isoform X1 n=1 Tax=Amphiura filiformis TaxID=82378 RepID=UPI003B214C81